MLKRSEYQLAYCLMRSMFTDDFVFYHMVNIWKDKAVNPYCGKQGLNPIEIDVNFAYFYTLITGKEQLNSDLAYKVNNDIMSKNYSEYLHPIINPGYMLSLAKYLDNDSYAKVAERFGVCR